MHPRFKYSATDQSKRPGIKPGLLLWYGVVDAFRTSGMKHYEDRELTALAVTFELNGDFEISSVATDRQAARTLNS